MIGVINAGLAGEPTVCSPPPPSRSRSCRASAPGMAFLFATLLLALLAREVRPASAQARVVMGRAAEIEDFPHGAALLSGGRQWCGAVLLSSRFAMTAAHCLDERRLPREYELRFGRTKLSEANALSRVLLPGTSAGQQGDSTGSRVNATGPQQPEGGGGPPPQPGAEEGAPASEPGGASGDTRGQKVLNPTVAAIVEHYSIHPNYSHAAVPRADVAILRLLSPGIDFDAARGKVRPARLLGGKEAKALREGADAYISGWGRECFGCPMSDTLQAASVRVLSAGDGSPPCAPEYAEGYESDHMMCAGCAAGGIDTCQADSGGPLTVLASDGRTPLVAGMTSWGWGCAQPGWPGVYTRLERFSDWILDMILKSKTDTSGALLPTTAAQIGTGVACAGPAARSGDACGGAGAQLDGGEGQGGFGGGIDQFVPTPSTAAAPGSAGTSGIDGKSDVKLRVPWTRDQQGITEGATGASVTNASDSGSSGAAGIVIGGADVGGQAANQCVEDPETVNVPWLSPAEQISGSQAPTLAPAADPIQANTCAAQGPSACDPNLQYIGGQRICYCDSKCLVLKDCCADAGSYCCRLGVWCGEGFDPPPDAGGGGDDSGATNSSVVGGGGDGDGDDDDNSGGGIGGSPGASLPDGDGGGEGDGQGGDESDHAGDDGGQGPPAGGGTINGTQPELPSAPQANVTGDGGADGEQAVDGDGAAANGTGQDAQGAPGPIPGPERR